MKILLWTGYGYVTHHKMFLDKEVFFLSWKTEGMSFLKCKIKNKENIGSRVIGSIEPFAIVASASQNELYIYVIFGIGKVDADKIESPLNDMLA